MAQANGNDIAAARDAHRETPGISVEGLSYRYGPKLALDGVSFTVGRGRFCALLGPNGAGKTTLFALLTRLFAAPAGHIEIGGFDLARKAGAALARLGVVFQQPTLDLDLTVRQNLKYFGALHGLSGKLIKQRTRDGLVAFEMADRIDEKVRQLNGGHRRRVEIARALLHDPAVLLLDEPTVGLDVPTRAAIVERVHALCRDMGLTVLWATHLVDEVRPGDDLIVLHEGVIRGQGPVPQVLESCGAADVAAGFARLTGGTAAP
jgi:ABC-2 type transport system ATP-binding protein